MLEFDVEPRPDRATRQRRDRLRSSDKDPLLVRKYEARSRTVLTRRRRLDKHFRDAPPPAATAWSSDPDDDADDDYGVVVSSASVPLPMVACVPHGRLSRYFAEFREWIAAALRRRS